MSDRLTIEVEGIEDAPVIADIEQAIRASFQEMFLPGAWRVVVRPSHVSGRWDFRVYGLDARHTMSITVPPSLLSSLIPQRLRESLERSGLRRVQHAAPRTRGFAMGRIVNSRLKTGTDGRAV
jgi:hypothetical protein